MKESKKGLSEIVEVSICSLGKSRSSYVIMWSQLRQAIFKLYRDFCFPINQAIQAGTYFWYGKGQRKLLYPCITYIPYMFPLLSYNLKKYMRCKLKFLSSLPLWALKLGISSLRSKIKMVRILIYCLSHCQIHLVMYGLISLFSLWFYKG